MNENHVYDMIIVGGGPGGYTSALYAARAGFDTIVLEKLSAGGQMSLTWQIDNYPGFENGIDGFSLAEKMQKQAEKFGAKSEYAEVYNMDLTGKLKRVETSSGIYIGKTVVIATGANPRELGLAKEKELIGHGVAYCASCDGMFYKDKIVVVVGGGNSAVSDAGIRLMKIILSPAKKMITDTDSIAPDGLPEFIEKTTEIQSWLKSKSKEELKTIWKCNDKITEQNFNRLENMDLYHLLTPAVLSYEGIAFQYMAPSVFEDSQFEYVQNHLRIISAFYGVLKPRDGVTPYRLEMQAKVGIGETKNLYEYWGDLLYRSVIDNSRIIINLASKEYSKCIEKYLTRQDRYITITFCELSGDKLVTKGTYAKMARGEMVRFMAENRIENPEDIKKFDRLGYSFRSDLSSDAEYVFERKTEITSC